MSVKYFVGGFFLKVRNKVLFCRPMSCFDGIILVVSAPQSPSRFFPMQLRCVFEKTEDFYVPEVAMCHACGVHDTSLAFFRVNVWLVGGEKLATCHACVICDTFRLIF